MQGRSLWKILKWVGGVLGYLIGSVALAVAGSLILLIAFSRGDLDDSPGTGIAWFFLAVALFYALLAVGFFLLVEILHSRLLEKTKIHWRRLCLRQIVGLGSLIGPSWILTFWPPLAAYRSRFETPSMQFLIYSTSAILFLIAIGLPLRLKGQASLISRP
ncbi:MAG TPA: hypothetical protein VGS10_04510 [Terracidiphilus sp.]|nr:hypothetical protein [Terracidiphilus sp.]